MKRFALLPLAILVAACSATPKDQFDIPLDHTINDCQHSGVEVMVGLSGMGTAGEDLNDRLTFIVNVANDTRKEITVSNIRVEPQSSEVVPYRLDSTYRKFNVTIPENEEHDFELPISGHGMRRDPYAQQAGSGGTNELPVLVSVQLQSGEVYQCRYGVGVPH
jgi:hypothetical protein